MLVLGSINNLCSLLIFIKILKYFNVTHVPLFTPISYIIRKPCCCHAVILLKTKQQYSVVPCPIGLVQMKMGLGLIGKLGRAWVGAWYHAWGVVMWMMLWGGRFKCSVILPGLWWRGGGDGGLVRRNLAFKVFLTTSLEPLLTKPDLHCLRRDQQFDKQ